MREMEVAMEGDPLPGGWMSGARLVDGQVHRPAGDHTPFVHDVLRHLERSGFDGAPRVLGLTGDGREILGFLDGHVPVEVARDQIEEVVFSDRGVASAFALIRRYHEVMAQSALRGDHEVVCHGDLSPWNTVYDDRGAFAFIDWDSAAPGPRRRDVGYAVWRFLMLGLPGAPTLSTQASWLLIATEEYALWDRHVVLEHVATAQDEHRQHFENRRLEGDPRYLRLIELGALEHIAASQAWLDVHAPALLELA